MSEDKQAQEREIVKAIQEALRALDGKK